MLESTGSSGVRPLLRFPRLRDHGLLLSPVLNSKVWIQTKIEGKEAEALPSRPHNAHPKYATAVSEEVVMSLANESAIFHDTRVYDPVKGLVVIVFDIGIGGYSYLLIVDGVRKYPKAKTNLVQMQGMTYVSGAASNVLSVALLLPRKKQSYEVNDDSGTHMTPLAKIMVGIPKNTCQCEFPSEILQVVAFRTKWLAVRTRTDVTVLEYTWRNDPGNKGLELKRIATVTAESLCGRTLAHLEVNPYAYNEFLLVDKDGAIAIWEIDATSQLEPLLRKTIVPAAKGPEEFSNWRRAIWTSPNRLLLFARTSVFELSLDTLERAKLITAQTWSRIQDVAVAGPFAFILTSQEIIWTELTEEVPLRRLVSWKHFLDASDSSYRIALVPCEDNQTFVCAAYSRVSPLIMIYTFGFVNKRPCSVRDPYYIRTSCELSDIALSKSPFSGSGKDTLFSLMEQGRQGEVSFTALSGTRKKAFKKNVSSDEAEVEVQPVELFSKLQFSEAITAFSQYSTQECLPHELAMLERDNVENMDQDDLIQQFAIDLGSNVESFFPSDRHSDPESEEQNMLADTKVRVPVSLASVANYVPLWVLDIDQLDNMIEQLGQHYESVGFSLDNHINLLTNKYKHKVANTDPGSSTVKSLRRKLGKIFKDAKKLDMAAVLLATHLIQVTDRKTSTQLREVLKEQTSLAIADVQSIIDEWDDPDQVEEQPSVLSSFSQEPSVPTIRTQTSTPKPQKQKKPRKGLLHRALTQSQAQSQANSQTGSQGASNSASPLPLETSTQILLSQPPRASSAPLSQSSRLDASQPSQAALPQISLSPPSSQASQSGLRRLGPPTSQKRKKRKGGFA